MSDYSAPPAQPPGANPIVDRMKRLQAQLNSRPGHVQGREEMDPDDGDTADDGLDEEPVTPHGRSPTRAPATPRGTRYAVKERPSPGMIEAGWNHFLKRHGHLDAAGNVVWSERLQLELGMVGLSGLHHAATSGDIRAAEVLARLCLTQARASAEARVAQMNKDQINARRAQLLAALSPEERKTLERALAQAALPVIEGER